MTRWKIWGGGLFLAWLTAILIGSLLDRFVLHLSWDYVAAPDTHLRQAISCGGLSGTIVAAAATAGPWPVVSLRCLVTYIFASGGLVFAMGLLGGASMLFLQWLIPSMEEAALASPRRYWLCVGSEYGVIAGAWLAVMACTLLLFNTRRARGESP